MGADEEEQRDAEAGISKDDALVFDLLDALPLPIACLDARRRFIFSNQRHVAWCGDAILPVRGQSIRRVAGEQAYAAFACHLDRALAGGPTVFVGALAYAGSHERMLRATFLPHRLAHGRVAAILVCFEELSAPTAAYAIGEAAPLPPMHAMRDTTLVLAHELSQPLAAALASLQGSLRLARAGLPITAEFLQGLAQAAEQIRSAGEMVRQIRHFVRRDKVAHRTVDLGEFLAAAVQDLAAEAATAGITLSLTATTALSLVIAEPFALKQVIFGLVYNAMEALAAAPPAVAPAAGGRIWLGIRTIGDTMTGISISDSGPGIAPRVADHLFEPFVTAKPAGLGLGLAICRAIVRELGGELWLDRGDRSATTFIFTLPRAEK